MKEENEVELTNSSNDSVIEENPNTIGGEEVFPADNGAENATADDTIKDNATKDDATESNDAGNVDNNDKDKKEKSSFKKGLLIGIFSALGGVIIIGGIVAACVFRLYPQIRPYKNTTPTAEQRVDNSEKLDMKRVEAKLEMLQDLVSQQYLFDMDINNVEESIYKGYMEGLGDKYSQYYSAEEFEKLMSNMEGVFYGIGAMVQKDPDTGLVSVVGVVEDSPAQKAGVKAGDIIYAVGDTIATDIDLDTLVYDLIRGEKDTDVTITFIRDGEKMDITITRGEVASTTVYQELMNDDTGAGENNGNAGDGSGTGTGDNIGYIEVSQFTDETVSQFKNAVDDMIKQGAKGLVIDLRNNSGGVLQGSVEMADYLLPEGVKEHDGLIVYTANKDGIGERYYATDGHQVDIPIVLLVNENSASAAEVFTGAMMDYGWADVVGAQTFGKGIVQSVMPLADGSAVKMTIEHYYTPDGTDLHGEGLKPDYEVELDKECKTFTDEHDTQYAKAVELIKSKTK